MTAATFTTRPVDVWELEPGDSYILLEVRDPRGNVFRSHMSGRVDVVEREPIDTSELRAALAAGADFAAGSEIIAARVLAAAARI